MPSHAEELQRTYYTNTTTAYDAMHASYEVDVHIFALGWLSSLIKTYKFSSLLDVGSGTGRCLKFMKDEGVPITVTGIEPVAELRAQGRQKGLSDAELIDGDALALPFSDASIDVVCSF